MSKLLAVLFMLFAMVSRAFALPPATVADLTTGVSFADVGLAVLAISAALAAFAIVKMGAKNVLAALGIRFGG